MSLSPPPPPPPPPPARSPPPAALETSAPRAPSAPFSRHASRERLQAQFAQRPRPSRQQHSGAKKGLKRWRGEACTVKASKMMEEPRGLRQACQPPAEEANGQTATETPEIQNPYLQMLKERERKRRVIVTRKPDPQRLKPGSTDATPDQGTGAAIPSSAGQETATPSASRPSCSSCKDQGNPNSQEGSAFLAAGTSNAKDSALVRMPEKQVKTPKKLRALSEADSSMHTVSLSKRIAASCSSKSIRSRISTQPVRQTSKKACARTAVASDGALCDALPSTQACDAHTYAAPEGPSAMLGADPRDHKPQEEGLQRATVENVVRLKSHGQQLSATMQRASKQDGVKTPCTHAQLHTQDGPSGRPCVVVDPVNDKGDTKRHIDAKPFTQIAQGVPLGPACKDRASTICVPTAQPYTETLEAVLAAGHKPASGVEAQPDARVNLRHIKRKARTTTPASKLPKASTSAAHVDDQCGTETIGKAGSANPGFAHQAPDSSKAPRHPTSTCIHNTPGLSPTGASAAPLATRIQGNTPKAGKDGIGAAPDDARDLLDDWMADAGQDDGLLGAWAEADRQEAEMQAAAEATARNAKGPKSSAGHDRCRKKKRPVINLAYPTPSERTAPQGESPHGVPSQSADTEMAAGAPSAAACDGQAFEKQRQHDQTSTCSPTEVEKRMAFAGSQTAEEKGRAFAGARRPNSDARQARMPVQPCATAGQTAERAPTWASAPCTLRLQREMQSFVSAAASPWALDGVPLEVTQAIALCLTLLRQHAGPHWSSADHASAEQHTMHESAPVAPNNSATNPGAAMAAAPASTERPHPPAVAAGEPAQTGVSAAKAAASGMNRADKATRFSSVPSDLNCPTHGAKSHRLAQSTARTPAAPCMAAGAPEAAMAADPLPADQPCGASSAAVGGTARQAHHAPLAASRATSTSRSLPKTAGVLPAAVRSPVVQEESQAAECMMSCAAAARTPAAGVGGCAAAEASAPGHTSCAEASATDAAGAQGARADMPVSAAQAHATETATSPHGEMQCPMPAHDDDRTGQMAAADKTEAPGASPVMGMNASERHGPSTCTDEGVYPAASAAPQGTQPARDTAAEQNVTARDQRSDIRLAEYGIERRVDPAVEAAEWARRQAVVQRQRQEKQAERRAAAEKAAVRRAREQRDREAAALQHRNQLRTEKQRHLSRVILKGMTLRQALMALGFPVGAGAAAEHSAWKRARIHHHPDQSLKRRDSLEDQIMSEEVFKLLGCYEPKAG